MAKVLTISAVRRKYSKPSSHTYYTSKGKVFKKIASRDLCIFVTVSFTLCTLLKPIRAGALLASWDRVVAKKVSADIARRSVHSDEPLTVATFRSWRVWAATSCTGPGDICRENKGKRIPSCGAERDRTADPHVANVVLSQLSYCPERRAIYGASLELSSLKS